MKVILRSDVRDLGHSGELVEVKEGYARNYLLPRSLAVPATEGNLKDFNKRIAAAKEREERERGNANSLAEQLRDRQVVIIHRAVDGGTRLHGSVTSTEVAAAIGKSIGREIDRRDVDVPTIRAMGDYQAKVKLMRGFSVPVRILVADREPTPEPPTEPEAPAVAESE